MLGKLSLALLLVAAPALAADPASQEIKVDENGQAYRIKKICQTVEVSGSFIPRRSCVSKKILVKTPAADTQPVSEGSTGEGNQANKSSGE